MIKYLIPILMLLFHVACNSPKKNLPIIGFKKLVENKIGNKIIIDSVDHTIPDFKLINQDSSILTQKDFYNKVYVVDFFFTSCPTICPKVKKNMKKIYGAYLGNPEFLMLSHSIDVKYDTVGRLAWYASKMNISSDCWHLVTGDKDQIYDLAGQYYIAALENDEAPGGFDHSGAIALIDKKRRIRGLYDGTDEEKMDILIEDIALLLNE